MVVTSELVDVSLVARYNDPARSVVQSSSCCEENTVQVNSTPTCNFNAPEQLRRRRLIAQDMTISARRVAELIRDIDEARWHHFEDTECCCWDRAREAVSA